MLPLKTANLEAPDETTSQFTAQISGVTSQSQGDAQSESSSVTGNNIPPTTNLTKLSQTITAGSNRNSKKRSRFTDTSANTNNTAQSKGILENGLLLHGLLQRANANFGVGIVGLTVLNTQATTSSKTETSSFEEQLDAAAAKYISESPPFVHFSFKDSCPPSQLAIGPPGDRLTVKGGLRGYRMARASHGVDSGSYYYEAIVQEPEDMETTPMKEFQLPSTNLRLGEELKKDIVLSDNTRVPKAGHLRMGWSMRTGDLQAPVGYDRWSYGLRNIMGSRIHASRREDRWGGVSFGPGDVIGFAIHLQPKQNSAFGSIMNAANHVNNNNNNNNSNNNNGIAGTASNNDFDGPASKKKKRGSGGSHKHVEFVNHIRFFKNGKTMGSGFVSSRGVRSGGEAFSGIEDGMYCPAVSSYMGGCVRANFGPHFVYPIPPSQLPTAMKLRPLSSRCPTPMTPEEAIERAMKEKSITKKTDESLVSAFKAAIRIEAKYKFDAREELMKRHVEEIRKERQVRNINTNDLPEPAVSPDDDVVAGGEECQDVNGGGDVVMKDDDAGDD